MKSNVLQEKSYSFALRIIKLYRFLTEEKKEFVLSKQVLRSGTSIGANIEESIWWVSEKDFASKIAISYKEARETRYWIRLLIDSWYLTDVQWAELMSSCDELCRIMGKTQSTLRSKLH
jgi:four helix bundle protein